MDDLLSAVSSSTDRYGVLVVRQITAREWGWIVAEDARYPTLTCVRDFHERYRYLLGS